MTDDDIRSMLRAKAAEATVSDDAWDRIAARVAEPAPRVTHLPRRLAAVGLVAAVAAVVVVVAQNRPDHDSTPVAQSTTSTTFHQADPEFVRSVVEDWVHSRVPGVVLGTIDQTDHADGTVTVRFTGGQLATELLLRHTNGGQGLQVASATSDLVLLDNPTYDGHELVAQAVPAAEGRMAITYYVTGPGNQAIDGGSRDVSHETEHLGHPVEGADSVTVLVVLTTADGTTGIAEQRAATLRDPASVTGSIVSIAPITDAAGLETFQHQADAGRRTDLLDPINVADQYFLDQMAKGETTSSYRFGSFHRVDGYTGTVDYTLADGSTGDVELRRTQPDDDTRIWYVTEVTSDTLQVVRTRREGEHLVLDVRSTRNGSLVLTGGDAPIEVKAGQTVSISRTDGPTVQTGRPVQLRLMDGRKTLAVLGQLPRG